MSEFIFRDERGAEIRFQFLGWKDDALEFYATDPTERPVVFSPVAAYPRDVETDEPYRFPKHVVPREIIHWSLETAFADQQRDALREWAADRLAAVAALSPEELFPFDKMRPPPHPHTATEIEEARQSRREDINGFLAEMRRRPAELLIDHDPHGDLLDDLLASRWGGALREPWNQVRAFRRRWMAARYGSHPADYDEGTIFDFERVQYLLRAADGEEYHLRDCGFRDHLTPGEANAWSLLARLRRSGASGQEPASAETQQAEILTPKPSAGEIGAEAELQRFLSSGLLLSSGPGVEQMTGDQRCLFNLLVTENPQRPGWALSLREIGKRLNLSHMEVKRRYEALRRELPSSFRDFLVRARMKNQKGLHPAHCGCGGKVKTDNPLEQFSEED